MPRFQSIKKTLNKHHYKVQTPSCGFSSPSRSACVSSFIHWLLSSPAPASIKWHTSRHPLLSAGHAHAHTYAHTRTLKCTSFLSYFYPLALSSSRILTQDAHCLGHSAYTFHFTSDIPTHKALLKELLKVSTKRSCLPSFSLITPATCANTCLTIHCNHLHTYPYLAWYTMGSEKARNMSTFSATVSQHGNQLQESINK